MILCCGEALIDMIPRSTDSGETGFVPHAGGAVFNTAISLGRLGIDTGFISGLSTDLMGNVLKSGLEESKVNTDLAVWSDRPTTLAFVELNDGHASYVFYDENTAGRMLSSTDLPAIPDTVTAMYFGGISLISEPAADFYAALAVREAKNRVIVCDPNIRTSFIRDEETYRARLDQIIAHTDILKVSDEDLNWIVRGDQTLAEKVEILRSQGPKIVILTQGSDGATGFYGDGASVTIPVKKVTVVDTVGAGDTFNAGFLSFLSENALLGRDKLHEIGDAQLKSALAIGAKVAAITVSRAGANPPWRNEL
jgi:fructokinase